MRDPSLRALRVLGLSAVLRPNYPYRSAASRLSPVYPCSQSVSRVCAAESWREGAPARAARCAHTHTSRTTVSNDHIYACMLPTRTWTRLQTARGHAATAPWSPSAPLWAAPASARLSTLRELYPVLSHPPVHNTGVGPSAPAPAQYLPVSYVPGPGMSSSGISGSTRLLSTILGRNENAGVLRCAPVLVAIAL